MDSKFHARLLACTRLGALPIEIETGRWSGAPQAERLCSFGYEKVGDTSRFLHGCRGITADRVWTLNRYEIKK